jgi:malonyl-CoA decarboxylase
MSSFFGDMLQSITERGRQLLSPGSSRDNGRDPLVAIEARAEALLSSRGEASGMALADDILGRWRSLDEAQQYAFMKLLAEKYGPRTERLDAAIDAYRMKPGAKEILELNALPNRAGRN